MWEVGLPWRWAGTDAIPVHTLGKFVSGDPGPGSCRRGCKVVNLGFCGGLGVGELPPWP